MKYYYHLYLSDSLEKKRKKIMKKLDKNQVQINRFVVLLSDNPNENLEIYNSTVLTQSFFDTSNMFVVAITDSQAEAIQYIANMTQMVYEETDSADIKNYILEKQRRFEEGNV